MPSATPEPSPAHVVLGVSGGIAAYKAVEVLRRLRERGYHVAPVLTREATRFVGATTFSALASEPARIELYGDPTTPIPHTHLGQRADVVVVVPATAHLIARYAAGLADDLLSATLMATRAPVLVCPAMHTEMYEQPAVQENLATLRRRGVLVLEPEAGALAGGDAGVGRLPDALVIADLVTRIVEGYRGPLSGYRVLISAGGTREPIDPVRVITNRSSGRQGYALAEVAHRLGARVTLVSAARRELALDVAPGVEVIAVDTAAEMAEAVLARAPAQDAVIMAAAVADYTVERAAHKIKRDGTERSLVLRPTLDILASLVEARSPGQVLVGFAAETDDVLARAHEKLRRKGVDLLVANDVGAPGAGFDHETNEVTILGRDGSLTSVSLRDKADVAAAILTRVAALLAQGDR
ncbi:MAG: bifunctional phosphopantothenoylcysteine decarboxylase/phosphopantothenate--cysteine ligase CoaBC [Acidimicrobiales bacterium]